MSSRVIIKRINGLDAPSMTLAMHARGCAWWTEFAVSWAGVTR